MELLQKLSPRWMVATGLSMASAKSHQNVGFEGCSSLISTCKERLSYRQREMSCLSIL